MVVCGPLDPSPSPPLYMADAPSSSPRPNKTYAFQREPPEGCERVRVCEEALWVSQLLYIYKQLLYIYKCTDASHVGCSLQVKSMEAVFLIVSACGEPTKQMLFFFFLLPMK